MKTLSVKLPESLVTWLENEAKATRRSRSDIVREALESKRCGPGSDGDSHSKMRNMAEALDSLGETFRGPKDLSTNPKYLAGFGA
jgi:Arc/MetJ-type ribon-helix-helix transcriptional regulator